MYDNNGLFEWVYYNLEMGKTLKRVPVFTKSRSFLCFHEQQFCFVLFCSDLEELHFERTEKFVYLSGSILDLTNLS